MVLMLLSDARTDPNGSDALVGCQGQGGSKWFRCSCKMPGRIQMVQMLL